MFYQKIPVYEAKYYIDGFLGHASGMELLPGIFAMLIAIPMGLLGVLFLLVGIVTKCRRM